MPAPDRTGNVQSFNNVIKPLNGIVGHYSDLEVDALLAGLSGGTLQTVDLSAYATTAYVDGELAKVYDRAAVDAAIAAAIAGLAAPDLTGYATVSQVEALLADPANHPATDLSDYYTKPEVDQKFVDAATGGTIDLAGYATTEQLDATKTEILTASTTAFMERYTKQEVDGLFVKQADMVAPPSLDGYATEQYVDDSIARIPAVDAYTKAEVDAKVNVLALDIQTVNDQTAAYFQLFSDGLQPTFDAKADKATTYTKDEVDAKIPATGGSVDLSAYAKKEDKEQALLSKTIVAQGYGFGDSLLPPVALTYTDTGEGYGQRLVLAVGAVNEHLVYGSDLEPLNALLPRVESLESKQAPAEVDLSSYADRATVSQQGQRIDALVTEAGVAATERGSHSARITALELGGGSSVDVSGFAKLTDANQTIVASAVEANRFRLDATRSLILLVSGGQERLVYKDGAKNNALAFVSELSAYCTIMDAATQIAACAKKADTYTKTDCDTKFLTLVDIDRFPFKTDVYTKDEVETRLLQVPSPMKYLQWGGAFQKMLAGNAKDKWFAAGLVPSIQIVKGKRYRLEMTTKFGPINTDTQQCWVGFRFNYKALNELPCTKQPLVTMGGFGSTTVTRARANIAATAVATTTPTRADRFRFCYGDDWLSAEDIIEYAVEFEADQDIASANFVPEICFGGVWGVFPANFEGIVAVFRQMD